MPENSKRKPKSSEPTIESIEGRPGSRLTPEQFAQRAAQIAGIKERQAADIAKTGAVVVDQGKRTKSVESVSREEKPFHEALVGDLSSARMNRKDRRDAAGSAIRERYPMRMSDTERAVKEMNEYIDQGTNPDKNKTDATLNAELQSTREEAPAKYKNADAAAYSALKSGVPDRNSERQKMAELRAGPQAAAGAHASGAPDKPGVPDTPAAAIEFKNPSSPVGNAGGPKVATRPETTPASTSNPDVKASALPTPRSTAGPVALSKPDNTPAAKSPRGEAGLPTPYVAPVATAPREAYHLTPSQQMRVDLQKERNELIAAENMARQNGTYTPESHAATRKAIDASYAKENLLAAAMKPASEDEMYKSLEEQRKSGLGPVNKPDYAAAAREATAAVGMSAATQARGAAAGGVAAAARASGGVAAAARASGGAASAAHTSHAGAVRKTVNANIRTPKASALPPVSTGRPAGPATSVRPATTGVAITGDIKTSKPASALTNSQPGAPGTPGAQPFHVATGQNQSSSAASSSQPLRCEGNITLNGVPAGTIDMAIFGIK